MTLYKWMLERDGHLVTEVRRTPWHAVVGEWTVKETPVLCESGFHAMEEKDVLRHLPEEIGAQLWEVEVRGRRLHGDDNFVAPQMRLVRLVGATTDANLRLFACDVSEDVLPLFEDAFHGDLRPRLAIEVARRFANGEATREELTAAWVAAQDAAQAIAQGAWAEAWAAQAVVDGVWGVRGVRGAWAAQAVVEGVWAARGAAASAWASAWAAAWAVAEGAQDTAGDAAWAVEEARYSNWLVVRLESGY